MEGEALLSATVRWENSLAQKGAIMDRPSALFTERYCVCRGGQNKLRCSLNPCHDRIPEKLLPAPTAERFFLLLVALGFRCGLLLEPLGDYRLGENLLGEWVLAIEARVACLSPLP